MFGEAPVAITINTTANFTCAAGYVWRAEVTGATPKIGTCKVKGGAAVWVIDKPCVGLEFSYLYPNIGMLIRKNQHLNLYTISNKFSK